MVLGVFWIGNTLIYCI